MTNEHREPVCTADEKTQPVKRACYLKDCYDLVITTNFQGADGLCRSFIVSGIPDEGWAKAFLAHMGWGTVPFEVK